MRERDTTNALLSTMAIACDAIAVFGGYLLATWIRFDSGWTPLRHAPPEAFYSQYAAGAAITTLLYLFVLRSHNLFVRPQTGSFISKIPRLLRANSVGLVLTMVLAFALTNEFDFSRLVIGIGYLTVGVLLLVERYILFRIEWNLARHSQKTNRILILGTDEVAARLKQTLRREPMLRSRICGYLRLDLAEANPEIPREQIVGTIDELEMFLAKNPMDQIILTSSQLSHRRLLDIILLCERNLIHFNMVPDLFRLMTTSMDVQSLDDIPLLGIARWPLDNFWNRLLKRAEDLVGGVFGLVLTAPVMAVAAFLIKRESPGPAFYVQERCGETGQSFNLYKLRTMRVNAEAATGPVFTAPDDKRRTGVGTWLRQHNIDELPQLWNVVKGNMSLVGPRPERPFFVEQFKEDIERYMWRHVSKPGMTGWAQVNGLRGDTSIQERVKYDLYYLENWSLAFDFKILFRTFFASKNAY